MVAAWTLQLLQETHDSILWCTEAPDFVRVDVRYGTSLSDHPPRVITGLSSRAKRIQRFWPGQGLLLRNALIAADLKRIDQKIKPSIWVSTFGEAFLPRAGLQYVHGPPELRIAHAPAGWSLIRRTLWSLSQWLAWQVGTGGTISNTSFGHRFIANSVWTANRYKNFPNGNADVIYPPVPSLKKGKPWAERENCIVCLGRWDPVKRMKIAVDIVQQARANGASDLRLAFVGFWDCQNEERIRILRHCAEHDWIEWHENIDRQSLENLAGGSRYGLHAMLDEQFGIATAELMTAGCIVFAHNSGGPPLIIEDPRQLYDTVDEGAQKIAQTFATPALQVELHEQARPRGLRFSPTAFCDAMRAEINAIENPDPNE